MVNVTSYLSGLSNLTEAVAGRSTDSDLLEDYPGCGIMNNDTFNLCPANNPSSNYCTPNYGGSYNSNWTAQCLWDCTWQENPNFGKSGKFIDPIDKDVTIDVKFTMPKVPVDLRCLERCFTPFNCNDGRLNISELGCFLLLRDNFDSSGFWSSSNHFDLALESCVLASLNTTLYPEGNCSWLGVNLNSNPQSALIKNNTKTFGPSSSPIFASTGIDNYVYPIPLKNRYPWQCSLRTPGFTGVHRCGVTLISGPPKPTIFVSAAHCNYLCKNNLGLVVEICCCLGEKSRFSCSDSSFCGLNPTYQKADPLDLQIACNVPLQEPLPLGLSSLNTTIFTIKEIRIHPEYTPLNNDSQEGGPKDGYDISVYIVDDRNFTMNSSFIWPACLPKSEEDYIKGNRGILAGWIAPTPFYHLVTSTTLRDYELANLWQSEALYERINCADPAWMNSSSYYPNGTICFTDVAWASTVEFGVSGSGIVRPFLFTNGDRTTTRYSWAGPLSFSRGSDRVVRRDRARSYSFRMFSSNPAVFTDALCYMDWIAAQYNLRLPPGYAAPQSCLQSSRSKQDVNKIDCLSYNLMLQDLTGSPQPCDFSKLTQCKLEAFDERLKPAKSENFYICHTSSNKKAICANNCPGVDANAVVVGGEAALLSVAAAASVAGAGGPGLIQPALGAGSILAMFGLGNMAMGGNRAACPAGLCRTRLTGGCCPFTSVRGRNVCPSSCN